MNEKGYAALDADGRNADMSRKEADRVREGAGMSEFAEGGIVEGMPLVNAPDTREKLEADVDKFAQVYYTDHFLVRDKVLELLDRQAAITRRECEQRIAELKGAINERDRRIASLRDELKLSEEREISLKKSCEHWQRVAGKHAAEMQKLRKERDGFKALLDKTKGQCDELAARAMPEGMSWPRFEDGELVKPFDKVPTLARERVKKFIYTTSGGGSWQLQDAYGFMVNVFPNSADKGMRTVRRPPLKAKDGEPIEVGETLYGEDGKAWEVTGLRHGSEYPVQAWNPETHVRRDLKPGWLTHEQPDSWERIASEMGKWMLPNDMSATGCKLREWRDRQKTGRREMNRKDAESDARDTCEVNDYRVRSIAMNAAMDTRLTRDAVELRLQAAIVQEVADIYEEFGEE